MTDNKQLDLTDGTATMTVYAVLGYDQYYPAADNVIRVFNAKTKAEQLCRELNEPSGNPNYKELYAELREKYPWLPKYKTKYYEVVEYEVYE